MDSYISFIKKMAIKGHFPATSSNFSYLLDDTVYISRSGIDKAEITGEDFLPSWDQNVSAEAKLHLWFYEQTNAQFCYHSHSLNSLLIAEKYSEKVQFKELEIIKAFNEERFLEIPIVKNSQDMNDIINQIKGIPLCYIIKDHGYYVWADELKKLKRYVEALEYLFEREIKARNL